MSEPGQLRLGIVGGTFDPIHRGHVAMAEVARNCARLDRVLLVPAGRPPHRGQPEASDQDRLAMCRLAVEGHPGLEVSDLELRRQGPSYTVLTLWDLHRDHPAADLYLVLGWDAARDFAGWHEPDRVLEMAHLVVVPRPGLPAPTTEALRRAKLPPDRVQVCSEGTPEIGATDLRHHLHNGSVPPHTLDAAVAAYIDVHGLYRG